MEAGSKSPGALMPRSTLPVAEAVNDLILTWLSRSDY